MDLQVYLWLTDTYILKLRGLRNYPAIQNQKNKQLELFKITRIE